MDIHQLVTSKTDDKKLENFFKELQQFDKKKDYSKLSKSQIELGLIFLNGIPELRNTENDPNHYYGELVVQNSKKYNRIVALCGGETSKNNIWSENNALWTYFFGEEKAKFLKDAMDFYPKMPFQQGYYRQALRMPNNTQMHFLNQINGVIALLSQLIYDFTLAEYAIYSNYLNLYYSNITYFWAAAINQKDKNILPVFLDIIYGKHETGTVSQPIVKAMLMSDNVEAWEAVEKLLLAAQRQEGLRQVVLECLSEISVGAMKHFIKLILKEKLTRFSSVIRALDAWAGLGWEAQTEKTIIHFLELSDKFLNEISQEKPLLPDSKVFLNATATALESKDNAEIYMALWAQGVYDVEKTYPLLNYLIDNHKDKKKEKQDNSQNQILALYFVQQMKMPEISLKYALKLLKSEDLSVLTFVLPMLNNAMLKDFLGKEKDDTENSVFDTLKEKLSILPAKPKTFEGLIFPWHKIEISKDDVFWVMLNLIDFKQEEEIDKILPFFGEMNSPLRQQIVYSILPNFYQYEADGATVPALTKKQRDFAFSIIKDKTDSIRTSAINAFQTQEIEEKELPIFEDILSRKSAGMRKTVIDILLKLKPALLQISTERLLKSGAEQRLAGLDLLTQIKIAKLLPLEWIDKTALKFSQNPKITPQEKIMVDVLVSNDVTLDYNAENGFGLYNPKNTTPYQNPTFPTSGEYVERTKNNPSGISLSLEHINNAFEKLKKLYLENQNFEYTIENWDNSCATELLGNRFSPLKANTTDFTNEQLFDNYPLADVWKKWFEDAKFTDLDWYLIQLGRNITPMILEETSKENSTETKGKTGKISNSSKKSSKKSSENVDESQSEFIEAFLKTFQKVNDKTIQATIPTITEGWYNPIDQILSIFSYLADYPKKLEFLEGFTKTLFVNVAEDELSKLFIQKDQWGNESYQTWRDAYIFSIIFYNYSSFVYEMNDAQFAEFWQLDKWKNDTIPEYPNKYPYIAPMLYYARAFYLKLITKDELFGRIMQPDFIAEITAKSSKKDIANYAYQQKPLLEQFPYLNDYKDIVRDRILEIELKRGDSATPVTHLVSSLQSIFGISVFVDILAGLGKDTLNRGYIYSWGGQTSKKEILSTLLKKCETRPNETQEDFKEKIKAAKIAEKRLVEAATYAPQWLKYVAKNLGWEEMEKAVWWLHAHTNSYHSAETETEIAKYSKVEIDDFKEGAVDREWFKEAYASLGEERWKMLYEAAKYISDGNGHIRAKLYADVILGNITLEDITKKITEKRNQDYLRVFGLFVLSEKNQKDKDKEVLSRYQFLQKFKKESKQFGAQKQASEALAVRIAMDNLARTAGFPDPMRLTWAMETQEAIDIMSRAKALNFNETTISLIVDEDGKSSLECFKANKQLKSIPDALKKEPAVIELKEFNTTLTNQYKRTRKSLEEAMVNGDAFTLSEITNLMNHPVVSPMLRKLVLKITDKTAKTSFSLGFWKENSLVSATGEVFEPNDTIQIAHCVDLYEDKHWSDYQKYCFENEIKQPFKQIFRELYVPTADELKEKTISRRYAGHQVQTFKAVALLKGQGWSVDYDEGLQKVFHKEHYIAKMYAMADWFSPSNIESPTLETIEFIDQKTGKLVIFEDMNKRIFSEVMRDIDLVVSVAHVGELDVEASQSSIELRTALVRETMRLFKITNVELKGAHALIKGTRGNYSVHLGSAVAHKVASSALFILPVHSQQRGKMFLPFLDEDPKTAEIMSKILLLAKDNEIQDPTILSQLI